MLLSDTFHHRFGALLKTPSRLKPIWRSRWEGWGVEVWMKREDELHPHLSGNKARKLKYNLQAAVEQGCTGLLTFGGAYSNHIYAVAAAGAIFGFRTVGIVRGEELSAHNPTLRFCTEQGMELHFIDRSTYRRRRDPSYLVELQQRFPGFFLIPEGGTNDLALKGVAELVPELEAQMQGLPDFLCVPCGTGGTLAGLVFGLRGRAQVVGFSALKGTFLREEVWRLLLEAGCSHANWTLHTDFHFGGFARWNEKLLQFIRTFHRQEHVPLEPVYTGKMMWGLWHLLERGTFSTGSRVLALHTGGLQGFREG